MKKIPLGATITQAWRFAVMRFAQILGVLWLPLALTWGLSFALQSRIQPLSARIMARDLSAAPQLWTILLPFYFVVAVLMFMQTIGVARLALGLRRPAWFYFSLGKPVWRLLGNVLLFFLIMALGIIAAMLAAWLAGWLLGAIGRAVNFQPLTATLGFVTVIVLIAIWCAWIYLLVRLSFLLVPVVAAEEPGMALSRGWALGHGNFWRMLAALASFLVPVLALELVLVFGFMLRGVSFPPPHATAAQQSAFQAAMQARQAMLTGEIYHYWYISFPLIVVLLVLFYGVGTGLQCFAYQSLTSDEVAGG